MAIPVGSADWRCGAKRKGAAMPPLPLRIDEVIERAFRTAAFDGRKVTLRVIFVDFAMSARCPLLPRERPQKRTCVLFDRDARLLCLNALPCQLFPTLSR